LTFQGVYRLSTSQISLNCGLLEDKNHADLRFYKRNRFGVFPSPPDRSFPQNEPILKPSLSPLLHLPFSIPHCLYDIWLIIAMHIFALISHLSSLALVQDLQDDEEDVRLQHEIELPHGRFLPRILRQGLRYMQVKKDIVRRGDSSQRPPWEFGLYSECQRSEMGSYQRNGNVIEIKCPQRFVYSYTKSSPHAAH
jgi:hypothetical protein